MPTLPSGATETSSQVLSTSTPFTLPSGASTTLEPQSTSSAHSSTAAESSASETQTPFTTATEVTYTTETETSTLSAASIQTDLSTAHSSTVEPSPSESSSASASMAPETSSESMTTWTTATDMTYTTSISSAEVTSSSEMLHASTTSAVAPSTLTDAPTTETETTSTIVTTTSTPFAVIDGSIWSDLNLDGVQDSSDVPVAGETVTISDSNGTVLATGVTNSTGGFSIIYSPPASNATLRLSTASNITSGLFQTEVNGYQTLLVPLSPPGIEAGIWYDVNRDGISQVSEPTYSQAPVTVRLANGTFLFNTTTDTNGYLGQYATDIFPNTTIIFESENGVVLGNGTTNQFGAVFASIPLAVGIVEGSVFFDVSGNGVQDSGEAGLGNTMLNITLANGTLLGEVTTNSSGHFAFYTVPHPSTQFFIIVASDGTPLGNFTTDAMGDATVLLPLAPRTSTTAATAVTEVSTSLTEVPTTTSVTEVPTETTTESETTTVFATPTATSGALYGLVFQDLDSDGAFTLMVDIPVTVGSVEIFNSSGEVIASVPVDGNGTYYYLMTPPEPFTNFTVFWNSTVGMETVTDATGNSRVDIPIAAGTLRKRDLTNLGGLDPEVGSVEDTSPTSGKVTRLSDLPGAPGGPMRLANEEAEVAEKLLSSVKSKSKWAPTISRFGDRVWRVGQNSGDGPPLDRPFFRDQ